jgi:hypothetical protein
MNSRALKLDKFIAEYRFWGEWEVSYTDKTHLTEGEYVKLGDIIIDASEEIAQDYPILPFTFRPVTECQIKFRFSELPEGEKQADRAKEIIRNELADSMVRTGFLRPKFCLMEEQKVEMGFREVMKKLSAHGYLILVVDTSALRRAVASFLHKTLSNVLIWTVVPVFVMTEVQRQVKELSDIWKKISRGTQPHIGKCGVLSQRPQVSCISRELNHIRQWRPLEMLTTLPEHLGQSNGNSNIDRLIIESVKNLKRDRGLQQGVYLLTGDKDMASLATLENQGSLHIGVPPFPLEISSVRYDSHNDQLVLTPMHYLLWDLAQVFSTIRLENKELDRTYEIVYYSQARGEFFAHDVMEIRG